jgi:hypothetical protein
MGLAGISYLKNCPSSNSRFIIGVDVKVTVKMPQLHVTNGKGMGSNKKELFMKYIDKKKLHIYIPTLFFFTVVQGITMELHMRKMIFCLACLFGLGLIITSCNDGTTSVAYEGTWEGRTQQQGFTITHILELDAAGTFVNRTRVMGITNTIASGTYSISGNTITFVSSGQSSNGTISGGTIVWGGITYSKI